MKANLFAVVLSCACISLPIYANTLASVHKEAPKININTADENALTGSFKGIGKKRAQAIIAYRKSHQEFKSLEELADVKGVGQRFVDKNREKLQNTYALH